MASNRQVALFKSRAHTFAGALACKWMVTKWAQLYFRLRALTDKPLQDTHQ